MLTVTWRAPFFGVVTALRRTSFRWSTISVRFFTDFWRLLQLAITQCCFLELESRNISSSHGVYVYLRCQGCLWLFLEPKPMQACRSKVLDLWNAERKKGIRLCTRKILSLSLACPIRDKSISFFFLFFFFFWKKALPDATHHPCIRSSLTQRSETERF